MVSERAHRETKVTILMRLPVWMLWVVLGLACGLTAAADSPRASSLARGEQLAQLICSACHVIGPDQEFPPLLRQPAPAFADIANRDGVTEKTLRHFIATTHWDEKTLPMTMPNPELTAEQSAAVVRYILSLRRQ